MTDLPQGSLQATKGGAVVLPCEPDQFRDFIAGLLGNPQTITRVIDGPFEVTREDVTNLYHLVWQRLHSQNDAQIIQFTARIVYQDKSSVLLSTLDEFMNYAEIKPLVSVGLVLSWTILVKFQNKPFPERQQIDVRFVADRGETLARRSGIRSNIVDEIVPSYADFMDLKISHTDRTWATDIDALISGHLELLRKQLIGIRRISTKYSGRLGFFTFAIAVSIFIYGGISISSSFIDASLSAMTAALGEEAVNLRGLGVKIDILAEIAISGAWDRLSLYGVLFGLVALLVSITLGLLVGSSADFSRGSYVLLTRPSKDARDAAMKSLDGGLPKVVIGLFGSVLVSVIGNYFFYLLVNTLTFLPPI